MEVVEMEENVMPQVHEVFKRDDELQGGSHEVQASDAVEETEVVQPHMDDMASEVVSVQQIDATNVVRTDDDNEVEMVQAADHERIQAEVVVKIDEVMQVDEVAQAEDLLGLPDLEVGTHIHVNNYTRI